jgi:hypothetical protein
VINKIYTKLKSKNKAKKTRVRQKLVDAKRKTKRKLRITQKTIKIES